jgi:hypothetical protein
MRNLFRSDLTKKHLVSHKKSHRNSIKNQKIEKENLKPVSPKSNKFQAKDTALLNFIYRTDPNTERKIQIVKQNNKHLPLEAYQKKLVSLY